MKSPQQLESEIRAAGADPSQVTLHMATTEKGRAFLGSKAASPDAEKAFNIAAAGGFMTNKIAKEAIAFAREQLEAANAAMIDAQATIKKLRDENAQLRGLKTVATGGKPAAAAPAGTVTAAQFQAQEAAKVSTMSQAEFVKLPHEARNAFIRNGGKISH